MDKSINHFPDGYTEILEATNKLRFDQLSDPSVGSLLSSLVASKTNANILELGTGSGLSTAWILQGMDKNSTLRTIDNEETLLAIARQFLGNDNRVEFLLGNGEDLIKETDANSIDFIFADTWPGKYNHLEETLALLKQGGLYLIDDMLPQKNWPQGHTEKAAKLMNYLENREDLRVTQMHWSTGIIICTKIAR